MNIVKKIRVPRKEIVVWVSSKEISSILTSLQRLKEDLPNFLSFFVVEGSQSDHQFIYCRIRGDSDALEAKIRDIKGVCEIVRSEAKFSDEVRNIRNKKKFIPVGSTFEVQYGALSGSRGITEGIVGDGVVVGKIAYMGNLISVNFRVDELRILEDEK